MTQTPAGVRTRLQWIRETSRLGKRIQQGRERPSITRARLMRQWVREVAGPTISRLASAGSMAGSMLSEGETGAASGAASCGRRIR
jgi:hypothetical protein